MSASSSNLQQGRFTAHILYEIFKKLSPRSVILLAQTSKMGLEFSVQHRKNVLDTFEEAKAFEISLKTSNPAISQYNSEEARTAAREKRKAIEEILRSSNYSGILSLVGKGLELAGVYEQHAESLEILKMEQI